VPDQYQSLMGPADWGVPRRRTERWIFQCGVMTFYLPNTDVIPTGFEPAEFIDPDPPPRAADAVAEKLAIVAPQVNGPLSVEGPVGLTRPDGSTQVAQRLLLCRCGHSASKPNCDDSHIRVGFSAPGVSSERTST
jgi:CDGSH-type Zn-finger protein